MSVIYSSQGRAKYISAASTSEKQGEEKQVLCFLRDVCAYLLYNLMGL